MARAPRKAAAPAPEPVEETTEGGAKRGPTALTNAHAAWLKAAYDVDIDPEHIYLAQTTRREFRESDAYASYLEQADQAKAAAEAEKAQRAKDREATRKLAEETPVAETAAPAPRARRGRAAAAPAAEPEVAEAPKPTRSRARKAAAPAAAPTETEAAPAAAPAKRTRKAPF